MSGGDEAATGIRRDVRRYAMTWVALVSLAGLSFGASTLHLGAWELPAAFVIATLKGALVLLVFMHFLRTRSSIRLAAAVGVGMVALLVAFATADIVTREAAPLLPALGPPAPAPGAPPTRDAP